MAENAILRIHAAADKAAHHSLGTEILELRAKLAAMQCDDELPPLPEPDVFGEYYDGSNITGFNYDQMQAYARDAQAMLRAKLAAPSTKPADFSFTRADMDEFLNAKGIKGIEAADLAIRYGKHKAPQQGETK
jgi:hypothetical protein